METFVLANNSPTPMAGRSKQVHGYPKPTIFGSLRLVIAWLVLWRLMASLVSGLAATPVPPVRDVDDLLHYQLDVTFDVAARAIGGRLDLTWRNTTGVSQAVLWFRLYPNAVHYGDGGTVVSQVEVDGEPARFDQAPEERAVIAVHRAAPIADGDKVAVRMTFTTTLPTGDTPKARHAWW